MANSPQRFRALLVGVRSHGFATDWALRCVKGRLVTMFPEDKESIEVIVGRADAKREPLRRRIRTWVDSTREGDICLFYYFGHGGRAKFTDLEAEVAAERVVPYLSCEISSPTEFTGLLSREISTWLSEADRTCRNVTAIIDSCYSGTVVRDGQSELLQSREAKTVRAFTRSPRWVREELDRAPTELLAAESHPRVVRLSGASPRREAHPAEDQNNKGVGMFTVALLDVLTAAGEDWRRLSWEMLAHAVRERVISAHGMEGQWISLAGPGERLLFSQERVQRPLRAVGYRNTVEGQWIRAGLLTGVEQGDRWAVADPFARSGERHDPLVYGVVESDKLPLNRAQISPEPNQHAPERSLSPVAATLVRVARPMSVFVDDALAPPIALGETTWLGPGGPDSRNQVRLKDNELELVDRRGVWARARFGNDVAGREELLELLEDRARGSRLVASLEALGQTRTQKFPVEWQVGVDAEVVDAGACVAPGSELWVRLENRSQGGPHWFTSVVLIDVIGRPWLLNASALDGVELESEDLEYIGRRPGAARQGVALSWPKKALIDGPGRVRIVTISSGRPIQLAHLTRALPVSETAAFRMQGLDPARGCGRDEAQTLVELPALSRGWGWGSLELELRRPDMK